MNYFENYVYVMLGVLASKDESEQPSVVCAPLGFVTLCKDDFVKRLSKSSVKWWDRLELAHGSQPLYDDLSDVTIIGTKFVEQALDEEFEWSELLTLDEYKNLNNTYKNIDEIYSQVLTIYYNPFTKQVIVNP